MIELKNLCKTYSSASGNVEALRDINLTIQDGEIFGIIGLSGAGKSTLVRCINLLERPTSGSVIIDGQDITLLPRPELLKMRRSISMIFQGFNLLEQRSVLRNVTFPLEIAGVTGQSAKEKAMELLKVVGLEEKAAAYPAQLSGGQKQRVAIARALASDPRYLLCDEATSALDPNTTRSILELLRSINEKMGVTIIVITHEMKVIDQICDRVAVIDQSRIAESGKVSDVFANPQSKIARELILPQDRTAISGGEGSRLAQKQHRQMEGGSLMLSETFYKLWNAGILQRGIWETIYMTVISTAISYVLGLPLGVILTVTDREGIYPIPWLNRLLGMFVNFFRSIPFIILMVAMLPVANFIVGTSLGNKAMIVMLVIAASPYIARMVESSIKEVDAGVIEAAQSMGANNFQIVTKVLLPEAKPSLIMGAVISMVTILGYSAMSSTIGGTGLGQIAISYGHQRFNPDIKWICVFLTVIIVQIIQEVGTAIAHRTDKRITK